MYVRSQSGNFAAILLGPIIGFAISAIPVKVHEYMGMKGSIVAWALIVFLGSVMMIRGVRAQRYAERVEYEGAPELATWKGYRRVSGGASRGKIWAFAGLIMVAFNGYFLFVGLTNPRALDLELDKLAAIHSDHPPIKQGHKSAHSESSSGARADR